MARNPESVFDELRVEGEQPQQAAPKKASVFNDPQAQQSDVFAPLRIAGTDGGPEIPDLREDNTLSEEFLAGLGGGIDSMQGSLYGVAGMLGRETGIGWLEKAGYEGAQEQFKQAGENFRDSGGFSDIQSAGGFFKWTAASLGEAIPSLATAFTGAGIGMKIGQKSVEMGVKRSLARTVERRMKKYGFGEAESIAAAREYMLSDVGQTALARAVTGERTGAIISKAAQKASARGGMAGGVAVSAVPQIGAIDQELVNAGVADPGLTALLGGIAGGALEAVPALRLMDKMFPGVDRQVSKSFIKDFAVATGTQAALEGSTEAAQEMIQLAALAYHDPTFDMFSPDARKRVIDAFAAGAIVGAVTGGGAEAIGAVNSPENRNRVKTAAPKFKAWAMENVEDAKVKAAAAGAALNTKAEEVLPEGFVKADNTAYEEIKGRVYGAVAPQIEALVNRLQAQVQEVTDGLNANLEGGLNTETATIAQKAKAAHELFLQKHDKQIGAAKRYMDEQTKKISEIAATIQDPAAREKYITDNIEAMREKLSPWLDKMRQAAAKRDKDFEAEVDNMEFPEEMLDEMNFGYEDVVDETERRVGPSGSTFEQKVGPAPEQGELQGVKRNGRESANVGEVDAAKVTTWGRNQLKPRITVDGKEEVVPYKTKADAIKGLQNLRLRHPEASNRDDAFRLVKQKEGGWVIEAIDPNIREGEKFWNDFQAARDSSGPKKGAKDSVKQRKYSTQVDGSKFGYNFKNLHLDLTSLAYRGKNLITDPRSKPTMEDGFLAMATELLTRDVITTKQFEEMHAQFKSYMKDERNTKIEEFAPVTEFPAGTNTPDGVAKANMMNFIEKMKKRGIKMPFDMLQTTRNENGTYSWGVGDVVMFRALRAKNPDAAKAILAGIKNERRQEAIAKESYKTGEFSGNAMLVEGSGDLGDTRGKTAGKPNVDVVGRVERGTLPTRKTDPDLGPSQLEYNTEDVGDPVEGALLRETRKSKQGIDKKTDPKKLPSEFEERKSEPKRFTKGNNQKTGERGYRRLGPQTAADKAILDRYARVGGVRNLLNGPTAKALGDLASYVRKTLGLNNQVIILDETGMQALLAAGRVKGAAFEQAIARGKPANIRLGDNSFIYLPNKIASDPALAVLAMGHEMGHHLYTVAWDKLTPEAQQALRDAHAKERGSLLLKKRKPVVRKKYDETKTPKDLYENNEAIIAEFNERYKDLDEELNSLLDEATDKKRIDEVNKQMDDIETNVWEIMQENEGLESEYAGDQWEAPLKRHVATTRTSEKVDVEADFNEWMADQLAAWITQRKAPKNKVEAFFAEVAGKIRRLVDYIKNNKRFQLNPTYAQFADAVAAKARYEGDIDGTLSHSDIRAWFKNDGVTMYKWFGEALEAKNKRAPLKTGPGRSKPAAEVDNMSFDFEPATTEGRAALARMNAKYPVVAKRAESLRRWVTKAYDLVLAPSGGVVRTIGARGIDAANQIADIFSKGKQGDAKGEQTYMQAKNFMQGQFMDKYGALEGLSVERKAEIAKSLIAKEGDPNATFTPEEQAVRRLFDSMHAYATKAGLPVHKITNYFPRHLDRDQLMQNRQEILDHLTNNRNMPLSKARSLFSALLDPNANDGRATMDAVETPGFQAMNSRKKGILADKFFDKFRDTNLDGIVGNYVNQVVKRSEFNRRLGEAMPATGIDARTAIKRGLWDPKGKMHKLLADAKKQGATDEEILTLEKYIDANLGQLGRDDIKPGTRKFMAGIMAYQNMRTLLFTVFASLPDMVGPAIRAGGMKTQFNALKKEMGNIAKSDSDLAKMAHAYGIISDAASQHIMTEYVDNHYMPAKARKMNEAFFKWTGLNYYTDFTRKMSLAVGIEYIQEQAAIIESGADSRTDARASDMLSELGITARDVRAWNEAGRPTQMSHASDASATDQSVRKVADALGQFVDESIMRPNASQRPLLASDPRFMLAYHLKSYMYAIHETILKRIKFNIDEAQSPAQYGAALLPAIMMMVLTAVGLELRELIQYAGSNRKPPTDRMDGWEYTWELMQRSGLTGFGQIAVDFEGASDRGSNGVIGSLGPTIQQVADWMNKPLSQTVPKAIPVVSQIPALRESVRNGLF